jgi:hypothetical protein
LCAGHSLPLPKAHPWIGDFPEKRVACGVAKGGQNRAIFHAVNPGGRLEMVGRIQKPLMTIKRQSNPGIFIVEILRRDR